LNDRYSLTQKAVLCIFTAAKDIPVDNDGTSTGAETVMAIRPGTIVEINLDASSVRADPLKTLVYDVDEKRLVLAQTSPPILPPTAKRPAYISYLLKEGSTLRRFGFSAVISGFDDEYPLVSGERVQALFVDITARPKEVSLRQGYRVRPPRQSAISLTIGGRSHAILDISISGIGFIQSFSDYAFKPAEKLACLLGIDGRHYPLTAKVVRVFDSEAARHIAAVFVETGRDLDAVLGKKILMLEREVLSRKL
jgi:hypothetical protein